MVQNIQNFSILLFIGIKTVTALIGGPNICPNQKLFSEVSVELFGRPYATGTFLTPIHVISSANSFCNYSRPIFSSEDLTVKGGTSNLQYRVVINEVYSIVCPKNFIPHNWRESKNDIAILVIVKDMRTINHQRPMDISETIPPQDGTFYHHGWKYNRNLICVGPIKLISRKECSDILGLTLGKQFICSKSKNLIDTGADEGSPLTYKNKLYAIFIWRTQKVDEEGYYIYVYARLRDQAYFLEEIKSRYVLDVTRRLKRIM